MQKSFVATEPQGNANFDPGALEELQTSDSVALAVRQSMALGQVTGDISTSDVRAPRLEIAYGVGKFVGVFAAGSLVLGGDNILVPINTPLYLIVLSAVGYWKEYIDGAAWSNGVRPKVCQTADEVIKAGGTTEWANNVPPTYGHAMDCRLLIQKPEGVESGLFALRVGDALYAPAIWSIDKTAYKRCGPVIVSAQAWALRERGLLSGKFELRTRVEKIKQNNVIVPVLKLVGHNTDAEIGAIKALFGAPAKTEEAPDREEAPPQVPATE